MALERDSRLGKYLIRQRIGAGGMGAVYRAYDTVLKREVAIKTILSEKAADRDFIARFRREALAISQIDDPHIVKLLDFVEGDPATGNPPYMVMEILRGFDLHSAIKKGPLEITRAIDIMLETCAAVGTCHRHGFVHRDLKATNIFLTEYNQIETAKVLDFGVAKVWGETRVNDGTDPSEVTRKGIAIGTPEYLAPEIFRGGAATPKTDQYSLGILLYTALTGGRKPFMIDKKDQFGDLHLWQAIVKGDHPLVSTYRPETPPGLEKVIERAMHRDPEERYASVHKLGEALLPWASPRARLQWTGHFTSAPKPAPPVNSMVIGPELVKHARSIMRAGTKPTVPAVPVATREVGSHELSDMNTVVSGAPDPEMTDRGHSDGVPSSRSDVRSEYVALSVDDLSAIPSERPSAPLSVAPRDAQPESSVPAQGRGGSERSDVSPSLVSDVPAPIFKRPVFFVGAAAIALVIALTGAMFLRGGQRKASPAVVPSPEVLRRIAPTPAAPPAPATLAAPAQAQPLPAAPPPAASAVPAPTEDTAKASTDRKRPARTRRPKPSVDENGIGIPSD